ncbi:hypothetical protein QWY93_11190 [Echinicola jeungdonensis]|uniref:Uncharacterized protein n=1 Tax=Echinicola jeungdonensis TaxID=709343 RepID=A0ABV5J884_9BACT|nr:hypothetical protein [Echinicola jeungdonensis]MDN3669889.1 hypothetical protein [Echinicola jeungdonensis]
MAGLIGRIITGSIAKGIDEECDPDYVFSALCAYFYVSNISYGIIPGAGVGLLIGRAKTTPS